MVDQMKQSVRNHWNSCFYNKIFQTKQFLYYSCLYQLANANDLYFLTNKCKKMTFIVFVLSVSHLKLWALSAASNHPEYPQDNRRLIATAASPPTLFKTLPLFSHPLSSSHGVLPGHSQMGRADADARREADTTTERSHNQFRSSRPRPLPRAQPRGFRFQTCFQSPAHIHPRGGTGSF